MNWIAKWLADPDATDYPFPYQIGVFQNHQPSIPKATTVEGENDKE